MGYFHDPDPAWYGSVEAIVAWARRQLYAKYPLRTAQLLEYQAAELMKFSSYPWTSSGKMQFEAQGRMRQEIVERMLHAAELIRRDALK